MRNELYRCRVCGLLQEDPPWGLDGVTASFDICGCCGVEFGYEDSTRGSVLRYRASWLASGAKWVDHAGEPDNWNLEDQLRSISDRWQ
jgi:hypothetical protein